MITLMVSLLFAGYVTYMLFQTNYNSRTVDYPNYLLQTTYEHPNKNTRVANRIAVEGTDYLRENAMVNTSQQIGISNPYYDFGTNSEFKSGGTDAFIVGRDEFELLVEKI